MSDGLFYSLCDHTAGRVVDGELVAINLQTGLYFASSGIGPVIWSGIEAGHEVGQIAAAIARHFGVPENRIADDVRAFLERLTEADLIAPTGGPGTAGGPLDGLPAGTYQPPTLDSYNDLEQAFAIDPPLRA